uniref:Uncharacterized protein n=1 Tax=Heterorhabditis bacteriophora TaxID=37862 RepID=A0A1I7WJF6_HETBA
MILYHTKFLISFHTIFVIQFFSNRNIFPSLLVRVDDGSA